MCARFFTDGLFVPHKHSVVSSPLLLWSTLTIIPAPHQLMASSMTQPSHYYSTQQMHVQVYRDHLQWSVGTYKAGVLSSPLQVEYNVVNPIVLPTLTQWCRSLQQNILCSLHCSLSVNRVEALGTTGLMTLRRWMVAGPEISQMIQELSATPSTLLTSHHGMSHNSQVTFKKDVEALVDAFCDLHG